MPEILLGLVSLFICLAFFSHLPGNDWIKAPTLILGLLLMALLSLAQWSDAWQFLAKILF